MNSSQLDSDTRADIARRTLNVLAAGGVRRFHAEPQVEIQTVGHHTYGVAAILIGMGVLMDPEDRWLLGAAILHDAPERRTGDMPFPVKRSSHQMKTMMDGMDLQETMDNLFPLTRLSKRQEILLKLADMLDGLYWCLTGHEKRGVFKPEVSSVWSLAIRDLLVEKHHHLGAGEPERFWAMFYEVLELDPEHPYPAYSTFDAFINIHGNKQ